MMIKNNTIISINPEILTTLVDDELGMMNIEKGFYYTLNSVGKHIWSLLEDHISVKDLVSKLLMTYEVNEKKCYEEVVELLEILSVNGLIKINNR